MAQDSFAAILKKLEGYSKEYPIERVHLHLDKPYYAIGDDIWFKAYITDSQSSGPSSISHILYVELINEKDSLEKQLKLPMQGGLAWGDFKLSDTLSEGNYRIRAYTQWMRNADPEFFFNKTIKIGNSWANKVFVKTTFIYDEQGQVNKAKSAINGTLQFTERNGKPYADQEVVYETLLNGKSISKERVQSNENGIINFTSTRSGEEISLRVTLNLSEKEKVVKIIPIKALSSSIDVSFFPEGGSLVRDLTSKIGIKAVNTNEQGEMINGAIVDKEGRELTTFQTNRLGMGSFYLSPVSHQSYRAKIKFKDGIEKLIDLPQIAEKGHVLQVDNSDSTQINIKVLTSAALLNINPLQLMVHQNGKTLFVAKIPNTKTLTNMSFVKTDLPPGIITLTLFSGNLPLAERIIFINKPWHQIDIAAQNLKKTYRPRERMNLSFLNTNLDIPVMGNFSVSVTNSSIVTPDPENESHILTSLLLKSDLKGYIEKPNYYFSNNEPETKAALDNLLLTQGWRKINWQQLNNGALPAINFEPEKTLEISGTVTTYGGKPVDKAQVYLIATIGAAFTIDTITDVRGRFSFQNLQFNDSTKFVIRALTEKDKSNVLIKVDQVPDQLIQANTNTGDITLNVNEELKSYLQKSYDYFDEQTKLGNLHRTIMLNTVEIKTHRNKVPLYSSNLNGPGNADHIISSEELETVNILVEALVVKVPGSRIDSLGRLTLGRNSFIPMRIVLDGQMMPTEFNLSDITILDIESIEVLKTIGTTGIYGMNATPGILVFTTKRGRLTNAKEDRPGLISYLPKGYTISREFYSPKHDIDAPLQRDLRTTVYWNPNFEADEEGHSMFNYYNTDQPGIYRILIEGIDAEGNLARKVYTYEVK